MNNRFPTWNTSGSNPYNSHSLFSTTNLSGFIKELKDSFLENPQSWIQGELLNKTGGACILGKIENKLSEGNAISSIPLFAIHSAVHTLKQTPCPLNNLEIYSTLYHGKLPPIALESCVAVFLQNVYACITSFNDSHSFDDIISVLQEAEKSVEELYLNIVNFDTEPEQEEL